MLIMALLMPDVQADDDIRLQLRWHHQFQFAGYYMALEQGYYQQAGLKVTIVPGAPGISACISAPINRAIQML